MIYELLYPLSQQFGWAGVLNVLRYVPFRVIMSVLTAMTICFVLAPWFIRRLQSKQIGQVIRADGPASHHIKAGTPTMGGALILLATLVPMLADLTASDPQARTARSCTATTAARWRSSARTALRRRSGCGHCSATHPARRTRGINWTNRMR